MSVVFKDNYEKFLTAFETQILAGLETCGLTAEGYAKQLAPVDTGNLRNSITHKVNAGEPAAYVGTNSKYAIYQEMGTGIYAEGGSGRPTPWVYQDASGDWHWTRGNKAHPFIKPSVADHKKEYVDILKNSLKNG